MRVAVILTILLCILVAEVSGAAAPADQAPATAARLRLTQDGLKISVSTRTPEQVIAFYSARGFAESAVAELAAACMVTVGIRNQRDQVVWLEPASWRLLAADGRTLRRLDRAYWKARWEQLGIPTANRSTFGWTQLPEQRDLRFDEPVGGNLMLARPGQPFDIEARFLLGAARDEGEIVVRIADLQCPDRAVQAAGEPES